MADAFKDYENKLPRKIIEDVKENGAQLFEGSYVTDPVVIGIDKIREKLIHAGSAGIRQRTLFNFVQRYIEKPDFDKLLSLMHDLEIIRRFEGESESNRGPVPVIWVSTPKIRAKNMLDVLLNEMKLKVGE